MNLLALKSVTFWPYPNENLTSFVKMQIHTCVSVFMNKFLDLCHIFIHVAHRLAS